MISFLRRLGRGAKAAGRVALEAAPFAAGAFNPALGVVLGGVVNAIRVAASEDAPGPVKKQIALERLETMVPELEALLKDRGVDVESNADRIARAGDALIEAILDLMKVTGELPGRPEPQPLPSSPRPVVDPDWKPAPTPAIPFPGPSAPFTPGPGEIPTITSDRTTYPACLFVSGSPSAGEITLTIRMVDGGLS